jgi:hypothetical protein
LESAALKLEELKRLASDLAQSGIPLLERISELVVALADEGLECYGRLE